MAMFDITKNNCIYHSTYSDTTNTKTTFVSNKPKFSETIVNRQESTIELVAQWFLNKSSMSNKKLQKLCYYAYAWFITFYNDLEDCSKENEAKIHSICADTFQAWIHGPVCPTLYQKYKTYGWANIPKFNEKLNISEELDSFLQQVWDAYGKFSADELESISHNEAPWILARKGLPAGDACANVISKYDILEYYSKL